MRLPRRFGDGKLCIPLLRGLDPCILPGQSCVAPDIRTAHRLQQAVMLCNEQNVRAGVPSTRGSARKPSDGKSNFSDYLVNIVSFHLLFVYLFRKQRLGCCGCTHPRVSAWDLSSSHRPSSSCGPSVPEQAVPTPDTPKCWWVLFGWGSPGAHPLSPPPPPRPLLQSAEAPRCGTVSAHHADAHPGPWPQSEARARGPRAGVRVCSPCSHHRLRGAEEVRASGRGVCVPFGDASPLPPGPGVYLPGTAPIPSPAGGRVAPKMQHKRWPGLFLRGGGAGGGAQGLGGWLCQPAAAPIGLSPLNLLL